MPQRLEISTTHLDELPEEESKHIPLNFLWPIACQDTNLTVIITCLKWTFNYDFCVRVTAYPLETPTISKQIDLDDHHPLLRSLTDALNLYEAFPEPHLNSHQLETLEELMEYLHFKFWKIKMPQNFENLPPNWDVTEKGCQNFPLTCPWTIACADGTLAFTITSLEWTFNYDFWIIVTAHPEDKPNYFETNQHQ